MASEAMVEGVRAVAKEVEWAAMAAVVRVMRLGGVVGGVPVDGGPIGACDEGGQGLLEAVVGEVGV